MRTRRRRLCGFCRLPVITGSVDTKGVSRDRIAQAINHGVFGRSWNGGELRAAACPKQLWVYAHKPGWAPTARRLDTTHRYRRTAEAYRSYAHKLHRVMRCVAVEAPPLRISTAIGITPHAAGIFMKAAAGEDQSCCD